MVTVSGLPDATKLSLPSIYRLLQGQEISNSPIDGEEIAKSLPLTLQTTYDTAT